VVSRLGDVGINRKDEETGYFARVSVYDLTDFSEEMHPDPPAERPYVKLHAIRDRLGFWKRVEPGAGKLAEIFPSDVPVLYTEDSKAGRDLRKVDPYGFHGLEVSPVLITKVKD
jgi:hypothetical protein